MQQSGFTNAERAQCVLWVSQSYREADVLSLSKILTERALQFAPQHDNGAMTTEQENRIIIEVGMDAQ